MRIFFTFFGLISVIFAGFSGDSFGAARVKPHRSLEQVADDAETELSEMEIIETLQQDIRTLDADIAKCEKQSKGWIAATVIGGAGIIGTGAVAISQAGKINEKKEELTGLQADYKEVKNQVNSADEKYKDLTK